MRGSAAVALAVGAAVTMTMHLARSQSVLEKLVTPGPLIAGHAKLERDCIKCHVPFARESQSGLCLACHKDIAADQLARKGFHGRQADAVKQPCKYCHTDHKGKDFDVVALDRETFGHDFTNFILTGAHKSTSCNGCHVKDAKFRDAPTRCFACHKAKDPHKGQLGEKCEGCHDEVAWRRVKPFDHKATKFPLEGAHASVVCSACHAGERYRGVATTCIGCHQIQDVHSGRYGTKCESCHDQSKWKTARFNHDKTKFPLRGGHVKVKCDACHVGSIFDDKIATTCLSCHKKDDVHKAQLGSRCEQCHSDTSWRRTSAFDHDLTRFPLIGRHAIVPCEECHGTASYKGAPIACERCHKDEHHQGRLGPTCATCHNPNGWRRWRFDHDKQTKYPLTGAHRGLNCEACHTAKNIAKISLSTICNDCHQSDDVHQGSFGRACDRCHSTQSFKRGARIR
jgi:hypothetical protein